ncbi:MAG TPA: helix-turn-helix transcriptional regulator [Solirubrobacterales bacterium]|nr:helix-turn-helix transcriptional regulator [Solirubrobacterales bacterium]
MAAVIRLMRLTREWSQEELGGRAEIKPSDISLLESGRRNPTLGTLQRLAEVFGVECSEMVKLAEDFESKVELMERRSPKS